MTKQANTSQSAAAGIDIVGSVKDAAIRAAFAAVLGLPFIGLLADNGGSGLILVQRWQLLAETVLVIFIGRLLISLWQRNRTVSVKAEKASKPNAVGVWINQNSKKASAAALIGAFIFPFLFANDCRDPISACTSGV